MEGGGPSPVAKAEALKDGDLDGKQFGSSIKLLTLHDLPPHVAEALRSLDADGDGTIDVSELHHGAARCTEQKRSIAKSSKFYRKLFFLLFAMFLAQLGATFGVVFGVVNYAKARRQWIRALATSTLL